MIIMNLDDLKDLINEFDTINNHERLMSHTLTFENGDKLTINR